jgi:DNA-binding transcriptional ArsR family regulator
MVYSATPLNAVFGALADPTRRAIVARLAVGETTVGELAHPFPMSLPAVGKHLAVLERAHLVERWRDGRVRRVRLIPATMRDATAWLDEYRQLWDNHLDRLAAHLGELPESSHSHTSER